MREEMMEDLDTSEEEGVYIDCTFGSGGHSKLILDGIREKSMLLTIDKDPTSIKIAKKISFYDNRLKIYKGSFLSIKRITEKYDLLGKVNNIFVDLGISSMQLNNNLGFSFMKNSKLDMRMNPKFGLPAYKWLKHVSEDQLSNILRVYGEERYYRKIAKAIKRNVKNNDISYSLDLVNIIYNEVPIYQKNIHFATRTFQAIRIAINNELYELKKLLSMVPDVLKKNGKLSIISFHSLEDRIIKNFYSSNKINCIKQIKKNIPLNLEIMENKRSRSAILRVFKKTS